MPRSTTSILAIAAAAVCSTSLLAAPVREFADDHVITDAMAPAKQDAANPGLFLFDAPAQPEIAASFANLSLTPAHFNPAKPSTPDFGNGADGSNPTNVKSSVVIPLPAPAGLALAGLLLVGSIRRR